MYKSFTLCKKCRIQSFSGLCSVLIWENTDQKNSDYAHFSRTDSTEVFLVPHSYVKLNFFEKNNKDKTATSFGDLIVDFGKFLPR